MYLKSPNPDLASVTCRTSSCNRRVIRQTLLIMKLTAIFILVASLGASARGHSQGISLSEKDAPLEKVFVEIKKQTGHQFFYKDEWMQQSKKVNIQVTNATLEQVLDICFRDQPFTYSIVDKTIVIKRKDTPANPGLPKGVTATLSPPDDIHGRIVNERGEPVIATVTVKGTKNATGTNEKGEFTLTGVDANALLVISGVNIETYEVKLNGRTELAINVKTKITEGIVVTVSTGYWTTDRKLNPGNITKVTSEEIAKQPVNNLLAALEGRVPGLVVTQSSGVPGTSIKVQIHGQNAFRAGGLSGNENSDPLFIIDGVPYAPNNDAVSNVPTSIAPRGISPFSSINPADIESVEVLKDADATAVYGSRGANGVILITTKKGKAGKTRFTFNVNTGISRITRMPDLLNTQQYLQMRQEAFANDGVIPTVTKAPDLLVWDTTRYTDFKKLFVGGTAHTSQAQASVSGGTGGTQFLLSGTYYRESTVFPGDMTYSRGSMHFNANHNSTDAKFNVSLSTIFSSEKNNNIPFDLTSRIQLSPVFPSLHDSTGQLKWKENGVSFENPMAYLLQDYVSKTDNLLSNLQLSYKLFPGLTIKTSAGYSAVQTDDFNTNPIAATNPANNSLGFSQFGNSSFKSWIIEPQAEYRRNISKGKIEVLVGGTWQQRITNRSLIQASGYTNDALLHSINAAASLSFINSDNALYRYNAVYGRLGYNWLDKYILNLVARRDGSSRFGPGKQFANFGSAAAAWIFSNESFAKKNLAFINYGKLRVSYGSAGSDAIGDYQFLDTWGSTNNPYQGTPGLYPTLLANDEFSWGVNRKLEGGLDLGFWQDRIQVSATWYINRSNNNPISYRLPSQTGFITVIKNTPALVQNTGWELSLATKNLTRKEFSWTSSVNVTIPENKLISFPGLATSSYSGIYTEGKSLSVVKAFEFGGVDPATGIFTLIDQNGDGVLNSLDAVVGDDLDPKFFGGFRNTITYKGWELDCFLEFRKQMGQNYLTSIYPAPPGTMNNRPVVVLDRWRKPGDITDIQKFTTTAGSAAYTAAQNAFFNQVSSGWISDASFARLKNLSLSYNFPSAWLKKLHIQSSRIYLQGQNLFVITDYKGSDPETQRFGNLPPLRTFVAGIQFNF
jgi:TonB-dependent starch-binding outer membrane protein SusC